MKNIITKKQKTGFTLVELLVVIVIIISLGAIGTVVVNGAFGALDKTKAQKVCADLVVAIESFDTDHHGRLPIADYPEGDDDAAILTDDSNISDIISILTNREEGSSRVNQAGKVYFTLEETENPLQGGLYFKGGKYYLSDPWGNPYIIVMDTNGDGKVQDPTDRSAKPQFRKVIVISAGPDKASGTKETNEDNITSFKSQQKK